MNWRCRDPWRVEEMGSYQVRERDDVHSNLKSCPKPDFYSVISTRRATGIPERVLSERHRNTAITLLIPRSEGCPKCRPYVHATSEGIPLASTEWSSEYFFML